jgi:serine/threonine protein kinase
MNEIKMLRLVDSNNCVKFEAVYETENSIYIVLEMLKGGEIFKMKNGALEKEQTKNILYQILLGITDLRKHKIVHRDLKPNNIMFKNPSQNS